MYLTGKPARDELGRFPKACDSTRSAVSTRSSKAIPVTVFLAPFLKLLRQPMCVLILSSAGRTDDTDVESDDIDQCGITGCS